MLLTYLEAENLKFKRSLFRKLVLFIPAALIVTSMIFLFIGIGSGGFSSSFVCNWCMPVGSLSIVILCHLVNNKDGKHKYRTLYSLPINLKTTFISKVILTALNFLIISLLLAFITILSEGMVSGITAAISHAAYYILAYCLLWLSFLWQIPFCLYLDRKTGFVGSVIINLLASASCGLFFSLTPLFWAFPYGWAARYMITLFGVLPNGLLAGADSGKILSLGEISLLALISLLAVLGLTALFARWYGRQVYRK